MRLLFLGCCLLATNFLVFNVSAQGIPLYQAQELRFAEKNGQEFVYNQKDEPFTGAIIVPDEEGINTTYVYRNGQKNGVAIRKFADEKVEKETTYANGLKNGEEIKFSAPDVLQYKKTYKDNMLNGEYILFYENGKPKQKSFYTAGVLDGETIYFDEAGNVTHIENYKNGVKNGVERIVKNNVLIAENIYQNGKLNGVAKRYNEKYLTDEINYVDGLKNGKHISYQADGSKREIMYRQDLRNGVSVAYYPNQKLAQQTDYRHNVKNGQSKKWNEQGILRVSENYKDNQLDGINRYFDNQGLLERVEYYTAGKKLAETILETDTILNNIYNAYLNGVLNEYSAQKNMWYKILWLGLNIEKADILGELQAQMKMYGEDIADLAAYQRASGTSFDDENRMLFFGLSPLGYAVNIAAPVNILQKLAPSLEQINELNIRGTTSLQEAVHLNNLEIVAYLLQRGANVKHTSENHAILFDAVLENADNAIIEELIKAGADVNAVNKNGNSALSLAIKKHHVEQVACLLENGADINIKTPKNENLLIYALHVKAPKPIIELLINSGLNINQTDALGDSALSYVLEQNENDEIIDIILAQPQDLTHNVPHFNKMLWQILAEQNRLAKLDEILAEIDIAKPDINGVVPQEFLLMQKNNSALIDLALKHIKDVDDNLMLIAVHNQDVETLKKLVEKGGNVNTQEKGDSLLMLLPAEMEDVSAFLLQNGADINYVNSQQQTVLMRAVQELNLSLVKAAISEKKNAKDRDAEGNSAVHYLAVAADKHQNLSTAVLLEKMQKIAKELIKGGADINEPNADGETVLILLAQKHISDFDDFSKMLQDLGADINAKDQYGRTAEYYMNNE